MIAKHGMFQFVALVIAGMLAGSPAAAAQFTSLSLLPDHAADLVPQASEKSGYWLAQAEASEAAPANQGMSEAEATEDETCAVDNDCYRGEVCIDGQCAIADTNEAGEKIGKAELDLDAGHWAQWGGLAGHGLWLTGLLVNLAVQNPTHGSTIAGWTLYTGSTVVGTLAANSAIDNVGVFGGPGQKLGSWLFFGVGVLTFGFVQLALALEDTANSTANTINNANNAAQGNVTNNDDDLISITPGIVTIFTLPSMASGALMSSVAMRAHRQVRRAERRRDRNLKSTKIEQKQPVAVNFNVRPYLSDKNNQPQMDGAMGMLSLRF